MVLRNTNHALLCPMETLTTPSYALMDTRHCSTQITPTYAPMDTLTTPPHTSMDMQYYSTLTTPPYAPVYTLTTPPHAPLNTNYIRGVSSRRSACTPDWCRPLVYTKRRPAFRSQTCTWNWRPLAALAVPATCYRLRTRDYVNANPGFT